MKKVLLVDDEVDHIAMMETRIEASGYQCLSAKDGEEGLKVVLDEITMKFNRGEFVSAYDKAGNPIRSFVTYWFAWYTFRPDTLVFNASGSG